MGGNFNFKETFPFSLLLHPSCRWYVSAHAWGFIKMRRDCTEGFSPFATVFCSIMLQYLEGLVTGLQWIHQDSEGFQRVPALAFHRAQGPTCRDGKSYWIRALKRSLLSFQGTRQKLLSKFFPLRGGGLPPISAKGFWKNDFPLRGRGGGVPP